VSARPPVVWLALARWFVAPRRREEAEGDLLEWWAQSADRGVRPSGPRFWREALSLAVASRRSQPSLAGALSSVNQPGTSRMTLLSDLAHDVRYALRFLRRAPGFSLATISMLTLGIGLVAGGYSVVNGLFLRPWPVPDADRVFIAKAERREQPAAGRITDGFSFGAYEHIRTYARAADYVAMARNYLRVMPQRDERGRPGTRVPEAMFASDNFLDVLGIQVQRGTGFAKAPASAGSRLVLSDAAWRRRFGADPGIVGRTVWLAGDHPATVVGIMTPAFDSLGHSRVDVVVDLAAATAVGRNLESLLTTPTSCCVMIAGRLRPGWTTEQARQELDLLTSRYRQSVRQPALNVTLRDTTPDGELGRTAPLVFALIGAGLLLIFVLTCANCGNLYLARSLRRRSELAVRLSLGASRGRLVRQLLTEGLVIAALAGTGAFLVTRGVPAMMSLMDEAPGSMFPADWRVSVVTAATVIVACLLVALTPALQATRINWRGATATMSARTGRVRSVVLAAQIAIAGVLVLSATLLLRGIIHASSAPTDYALHSTTVATIGAPAGRSYDAAILEKLAQAAETSAFRPGFSVSLNRGPLLLTRSRVALPSGAEFRADLLSLTRGAFDVLQVPLVTGRWASSDTQSNEVLVNEALASQLSPASNALGLTVTLSYNGRNYAITGIVRDAHLTSFDRVEPMVFVPRTQGIPSLLARTTPDTDRQLAALVKSVDPELTVAFVPLSEPAKGALKTAQAGAALAGSLGVVALLLAIIGVGGVFSYLVEEQRREIGIRLALGGSRRQIAAALTRASRGAVLGGLTAGLVLSVLAGIALRSFLFGLHPLDPISYVVVAVVLLMSALVATALPLRRALRVDPAVALRAD
jgi:putative ABC transport system permease protein